MARLASSWSAAAGLLLLAAGCGSKPTPVGSSVPTKLEVVKAAPAKIIPPAPASPGIEIRPALATLLPGEPGLQMVVQGTGPHGGRTDLTRSVAWKVEPPGAVEVDPDGYLRPIRKGKAVVVATSGPDVTRATIDVAADSPRTWDFAEDIEPVLTRSGCNTGGCHGRADGQNGFHLSLFGYDPEGDHRSMTRDLGERRLSPLRPESSLFLAKATGTTPHVGGPRLTPGSDEYNTVLAWMKAGAPFASPKNHGRIARLSVEPGDVGLDEPRHPADPSGRQVRRRS